MTENVQPTKSKRGGARPGAGRPVTRISSRLQVEEAREKGRRALSKAIAFWTKTIDDETAPWAQRHKAACELMDRCGLARRYEQDSSVAVTSVMLDPTQFVDGVRTRVREIQNHFGLPIERLLGSGDDGGD